MPLLHLSARGDVHLTLAVVVFATVVGALGHLWRVRWMIVVSIGVIACAFVYFATVLRPGSG